MIDGLKPYPVMKKSAVAWLGDMPAHWDVQRLRNIAEVRFSNVDKHSKDDEYAIRLCNYSDVYYNERIRSDIEFMRATATAEEIERFRLVVGDVLITKDSESWEDIGVPALVENTDDALICGYHLALLRPIMGRVSGEFLHRALSCRPVANQFFVRANGVTRFGLSQTAIKAVWLPIAPPSEQPAIVRFLDHADRRIQRYIEAKEKLIALLEEQKQAIIHQAVTGQIDVRTGEPYPIYKPSGVEWLGDMPGHWEARRLKSLVKRIDQGVSPQAENYLADGTAWGVLKAGCVNRGVFRENEHKRLPPGFVFDPILAVATGDVLVSRASGSPHLVGSVGRVSSLKHKLILSDKTFRPIFKQKVDSDFMVLAMNSRYYRQQVEQAISGAEGLANNLPLSSLRAFHFAVPGFDEQCDIVGYLRTRTNELSGAATQTQQEADLLHEYRTRLIADVVTGKLDVREAAAALPDDAGLSGNERAEVEDDAEIQKEAPEMTDWDTCPAVERKPGKVSGAWVFAGTRVPLSALYENLASGATIDEFVEWFPGVDEQQVRAVLEHEAKALRTAAAP